MVLKIQDIVKPGASNFLTQKSRLLKQGGGIISPQTLGFKKT